LEPFIIISHNIEILKYDQIKVQTTAKGKNSRHKKFELPIV
jgi:hypothetical protein